MALQTSTGYVRIAISTGFDNEKLNVSWMTFETTDWRNSNPKRVFPGIVESGSHSFDLAIKEKVMVDVEPYLNEEGQTVTQEEQETIIGYLAQSKEQAYELLKNLSVQDADFASVNWNITEQGEQPEEIIPIWQPDRRYSSGQKIRFFTDDWTTFEVVQDHISQIGWEPTRVPALFKIPSPPSNENKQWREGILVQAGEEFEFEGNIYTVVQSHSTLTGWEPPRVPALWKLREYTYPIISDYSGDGK